MMYLYRELYSKIPLWFMKHAWKRTTFTGEENRWGEVRRLTNQNVKDPQGSKGEGSALDSD